MKVFTVSLLGLSLAAAAPIDSNNVLGSILGTGSSNDAGNQNSGTATGNGNGNQGSSAGASNFLNGASALGNGAGNGNDGNSVLSVGKRQEDGNILGSILGVGSDNVAGAGNTGTAVGNGNSNTGATAGASNFLNGASASENGVGNGNNDNSVLSIGKRQLNGNILGSILDTGAGNIAGVGNSASATSNGNQNTGASAGASNFLNGASANDNGAGNSNSGNSIGSIEKRQSNDNILGSLVGTGSSNSAGDDNSASAASNGNSNTGASTSATDFLNGASATANGAGNDNNDNSILSIGSLEKRIDELERVMSLQKRSCEFPTTAAGYNKGSGSSNSAGVSDLGSAMNIGNSNTVVSGLETSSLNGAQASDNGILNDNKNNNLVSIDPTVNL